MWAGGPGFITGLAAAYLWGATDVPPRRITVQVPLNWHLPCPPWERPLRVTTAAPPLFRVDGVRVAALPDAVVQAWRESPVDVGAGAVIAAMVGCNVSPQAMREAAARRKQLPRRGQLAELIGLVGDTVTSYLEYVAWRQVFPPRLYPNLEWQVTVNARGRTRVMDAFDREAMIDLEFDGGATHGGVDGFERDRERDADMRSAGIEPLHFTYRDLTQRPEWCRRQYAQLRAARLRATASGRGE